MVNKLNDEVGKKIVEALKKQSETEQESIVVSEELPGVDETVNEVNNEAENVVEPEKDIVVEKDVETETNAEKISDEIVSSEELNVPQETVNISEVTNMDEVVFEDTSLDDSDFTQQSFNDEPISNIGFETNMFEEDIKTEVQNNSNEIELPANILILRKLISQLPSGVSRPVGAQIIKQTMEALGISMKSVLQEAQTTQEYLKSSTNECQKNIKEYKRQILDLETKSQNYQKQYNALNDLISLFIQTTK